mmetsp:Transcript_26917/g.63890  ORF Transcript_26917/g.63890 Transcript_26917/m.63890 type:complete len:222 (+) Transcript_26917:243-908(+)
MGPRGGRCGAGTLSLSFPFPRCDVMGKPWCSCLLALSAASGVFRSVVDAHNAILLPPTLLGKRHRARQGPGRGVEEPELATAATGGAAVQNRHSWAEEQADGTMKPVPGVRWRLHSASAGPHGLSSLHTAHCPNFLEIEGDGSDPKTALSSSKRPRTVSNSEPSGTPSDCTVPRVFYVAKTSGVAHSRCINSPERSKSPRSAPSFRDRSSPASLKTTTLTI